MQQNKEGGGVPHGPHFVKMKGMRCPKCMASEEGPRPVYR